jgi:ubiquitin-conjugating enzyme E2 variant
MTVFCAYLGWFLVSLAVADFIAGVFHWWEDRYLTADTPFLLGVLIGGPNKEHHKDPLGLTRGTYCNRNWTTIVPSMVPMIACLCVPAWRDGWLTFALLSQANEVHAWAHSKGKCNRFIELLQEIGLVQNAKHHGGHHKAPFEVRYCVMTNWLNPVLDAFGFWRGCENLIALTGIKVVA